MSIAQKKHELRSRIRNMSMDCGIISGDVVLPIQLGIHIQRES